MISYLSYLLLHFTASTSTSSHYRVQLLVLGNNTDQLTFESSKASS